MIRCPVCGTRLEIAELVTLTPRQQAIREAITQIRRHTGQPAKTAAIATRVGWSRRTVQYELRHLLDLHIIHRPGGRCSGYVITPHTLTLKRAA